MSNVEGVLQYRLLGSHPAASGRYYTIGFNGESISVHAFVERLVKEHRINVTRYKVEVKKIINETDLERENVHDILLVGKDFIHTYDRLAVTIKERHVGESFIVGDNNLSSEVKRSSAFEPMSITELESLHFAEQEAYHSTHTNAALHSSINNSSNTSEYNNYDNSINNTNNSNERGIVNMTTNMTDMNSSDFSLRMQNSQILEQIHPSSEAQIYERDRTRHNAEHDSHALERITIVAGKTLPINKAESTNQTSRTQSAISHICVLCDLPSFQEMRTPCCKQIVCTVCWRTAQNMMPCEGDCPVCGSKRIHARTNLHSKRTRDQSNDVKIWQHSESKQTSMKHEELEQKFDSKFMFNLYNKTENKVWNIDADVKEDESSTYNKASISNKNMHKEVNNDANDDKTGYNITNALIHPSTEVIEFERHLRMNLDKTLSFLDLCALYSFDDTHTSANDKIDDSAKEIINKRLLSYSHRSTTLQKADELFLLPSNRY